jgi:hypothetical protein
MRTEKELWEIVLSRPDLFQTGLCGWVGKCFRNNLINLQEREFLICHALADLPPYAVGHFCWNPGIIRHRIEWINNRIKQLS